MENKLTNIIEHIIDWKSRIFKNTESFFIYLNWLWINTNEIIIEKNRIYLWDKTKIWIIKPTNGTVRFLPLFYKKLDEITQWIAINLMENFDERIVLPQELLEWIGYKCIEINVNWKNNKNKKIHCIWNPSPVFTDKLLEIIKSKSIELYLPLEDVHEKIKEFPVKINTHASSKNKEFIKLPKKHTPKNHQKKIKNNIIKKKYKK